MRAPFARADALVTDAIGARMSAAVLRVERRGRLVHERAFGTTRADAGGVPIGVDTRFDLASLTKVIVAGVALELVAAGALALDGPLASWLPPWRSGPHASITLRMLLAHQSGMHSGADYRLLLDRNVEQFALQRPLDQVPGARVIYSDLGFIVLGTLLAQVAGTSLAALVEGACRRWGVEATMYRPRAAERSAIPATEREAWRGLVQGSVHDEKAHLMGGVAGHAGLFGPASGVARVAELYLAPLHRRPSPLPAALARAAIAEVAPDPVLRRGLGWALRTNDENSCGVRIAADAFGHTGFTGTCVWADPGRDCSIVLLTNAVHFGRRDLREVRAAVCDAVIEALDATESA